MTDGAWRAEAHGELPGQLHYALEHAHAGPNFHGYYSDTDTTYATVTKKLTPKFRVHASLNHYAGNLALNDVRSTVVNRESSSTAGASYALTKDTELSLAWQHMKRTDILLPAAYDFTEDSVRLGLGHNFGKLNLQSFLDAPPTTPHPSPCSNPTPPPTLWKNAPERSRLFGGNKGLSPRSRTLPNPPPHAAAPITTLDNPS